MTVNNVGSGLGSSVGMGIEGTYGTFATPTRWSPAETHELKLVPQFVQGQGLRAGALVEDVNERVWSSADVAGTVKTSLFYKGMGMLLGSLMGSLSTSPVQQGGSTAYLQTHALASQWNQSLSFQEGIPDVNTVVHTWNTIGAKVQQADFTFEVGQLPQAIWTVDAQDRIESGSDITTPAFIASNPVFGFPQLVIKVGAFGSEAQLDGIMKFQTSIKRTKADKRFNVGNVTTAAAGYAIKDQPVDNGFAQIGGTLDTEFIDTTKFVDVFMSQSSFSLIATLTGPIIATTYHYSFQIAFPCCRYTGGDPTITGPGIVQPSLPFIVLNDETHTPATITYQSTDTTL